MLLLSCLAGLDQAVEQVLAARERLLEEERKEKEEGQKK